jgi:hypothetical protein
MIAVLVIAAAMALFCLARGIALPLFTNLGSADRATCSLVQTVNTR